MTVYLDSFIIINFTVNYLILQITKKIHNKKTNNLKIFLGSIITVVYSLLIFIKNTDFLFSVFGKILFSVFITVIVFKHSNIYDFLRTLLVFYIVTFVFGGTVYAFLGFINKKINLTLLFVSTCVSYFFLSVFSAFYKKHNIKEKYLVSVEFTVNDKTYKVNGLVDTGNSLYDPYTKLPVMIVSKNAITDINKKFRVIPYKSVGAKNGMILGFTPDNVKVNGVETKCVIGIYSGHLSGDNSFNAILNPEIIIS